MQRRHGGYTKQRMLNMELVDRKTSEKISGCSEGGIQRVDATWEDATNKVRSRQMIRSGDP